MIGSGFREPFCGDSDLRRVVNFPHVCTNLSRFFITSWFPIIFSAIGIVARKRCAPSFTTARC
ncbi:hypothetical protein I7I48_03290 [Histoplasma ohiense]|nr:hypothetical protein I7I48_03290 [Histoplasma ohiense (nom. inval.)]